MMNAREMIEYILEQRKDLTEAKLLDMIAEKKERIGAGYLTDQGALFLIAAELGIDIEKPSIDISIKDLYAGAKDISIIARVLKIYPIKKIKRDDGSSAMLRTLVIYDNYDKVRLTLWDDMAILPDTLALKVGDAIRINRVYARSMPDGKISLSSSSRSSIEIIKDDVSHITPIDRLALDPSEITYESNDLVIDSIISSPPTINQFINSKGEKSNVLHMKIAGDNDIRVIVWNVDEKSLPKIIKKNDRVRLIGFKAKRVNSAIELHGDEGSIIELREERGEPDIIQLRILSTTNKGDTALALAVDRASNVYLLSITNSLLSLDDIKPNIFIECIPSRMYGNNIIVDEDSYIRILDENLDIPTLEMLEVKINDIKPDQDKIYFIEAIILLPVKIQEIQIRNESIRYAETLLGDDTGEIRLVAWRDAVDMIENLSTGKRIKVYGVSASLARDGSTELRLKPFSQIIEV